MGWATEYIKKLKAGEAVEFRPKGNSMSGIIESGNLVLVEPITTQLHIDDIVLCKVNKKQYIHIIKNIEQDCYLIGNNKGYINGWININAIYGKVVRISP